METVSALWGLLTTIAVAVLGFFVKGKFNEVDKLAALLAQTREEIARNTVHRAEYTAAMVSLGSRMDFHFQKLETKIDKLADKVLK